MSRPLLGVVSIGQTPRPDLHQVFAAAAPHAAVRVVGALDDVPATAIDALAAAPGDYPLLVRLADGRTAEIALDALHPLVERQARALVADGAYAIVIACAGAFPDVIVPGPVLLPGRLVPAVVRTLVHTRQIGVVSPICAQVPAAETKWRRDGFDPVVTWASPVIHDEIVGAANAMRAAAPELVVLDCMGHDDAYAAEFAARCGCPVVSAQAITARVAGALVPSLSSLSALAPAASPDPAPAPAPIHA
jgi:protein AroM